MYQSPTAAILTCTAIVQTRPFKPETSTKFTFTIFADQARRREIRIKLGAARRHVAGKVGSSTECTSGVQTGEICRCKKGCIGKIATETT